MRLIEKKKIFRVIDANLNRAKEGLRICEDITRFVLNKKKETRQYKNIRHELLRISSLLNVDKKILIGHRDICKDVGKKSILAELKRKNVEDVFFANSQRCKESARVQEELLKLINSKGSALCKKNRYQIYDLERRVNKFFLRDMRG